MNYNEIRRVHVILTPLQTAKMVSLVEWMPPYDVEEYGIDIQSRFRKCSKNHLHGDGGTAIGNSQGDYACGADMWLKASHKKQFAEEWLGLGHEKEWAVDVSYRAIAKKVINKK